MKKFFLYLGFIFLLIPSLPIVSTYIGKFFYSDNYKISNHHKKPAYVLVPGAGISHVGKSYLTTQSKSFPTPETLRRAQYGIKLSEKFSIPLILNFDFI